MANYAHEGTDLFHVSTTSLKLQSEQMPQEPALVWRAATKRTSYISDSTANSDTDRHYIVFNTDLENLNSLWICLKGVKNKTL